MELTRELLVERFMHLTVRTRAALPADEPILVSIATLFCDRCGAAIDPARLPSGWTTVGDFEGGWTDLCRGCSG